jgi:hypothetical protein
MNTPLRPNGKNPPPVVKFDPWNTLAMMKMTVASGTRTFQTVATVFVRAIHLIPARFSAVNRNITATTTARPFPVTSPVAGFTIPCQIFASRYPTNGLR